MDDQFQQDGGFQRSGGASDRHFRPHHRRRHLGPALKTAALIVAIVLIISFLALQWHGIPTLTSNQTFSVLNGQSVYFKLKGSSDTYTLFLENSSSAYAIIYISKVPVLTNPIVTFGLVDGQSVNISSSGSSVANLQARLLSSTTKSASIELTSIPSLFTIAPSSGIVVRNPASFYSSSNLTAQQVVPPPATTTSGSSNKTKATATNTTKTAANTTTTQKSSAPSALENASSILNSTYIGTLMNEYNALYIKDRACTSQVYGTDLQTYAHQAPVGPFDFANASSTTPTGLAVNATTLGKNNYRITYSAQTPSTFYSGIAVSFNLSTITGVVTGLAFKGVYLDQNYTSLNNNYEFQNGISGACGAYIP